MIKMTTANSSQDPYPITIEYDETFPTDTPNLTDYEASFQSALEDNNIFLRFATNKHNKKAIKLFLSRQEPDAKRLYERLQLVAEKQKFEIHFIDADMTHSCVATPLHLALPLLQIIGREITEITQTNTPKKYKNGTALFNKHNDEAPLLATDEAPHRFCCTIL